MEIENFFIIKKDNVKIELTPAEAKELYYKLKLCFGQNRNDIIYPYYPYLVYTDDVTYKKRNTCADNITYTSDNSNEC